MMRSDFIRFPRCCHLSRDLTQPDRVLQRVFLDALTLSSGEDRRTCGPFAPPTCSRPTASALKAPQKKSDAATCQCFVSSSVTSLHSVPPTKVT